MPINTHLCTYIQIFILCVCRPLWILLQTSFLRACVWTRARTFMAWTQMTGPTWPIFYCHKCEWHKQKKTHTHRLVCLRCRMLSLATQTRLIQLVWGMLHLNFYAATLYCALCASTATVTTTITITITTTFMIFAIEKARCPVLLAVAPLLTTCCI